MKRKLVYVAAIVLAVLHQDFWLWDDPSLVFGFLPAGLAYHVAYSVAASGLWIAATRWAWPADLTHFAVPEDEEETASRRS